MGTHQSGEVNLWVIHCSQTVRNVHIIDTTHMIHRRSSQGPLGVVGPCHKPGRSEMAGSREACSSP